MHEHYILNAENVLRKEIAWLSINMTELNILVFELRKENNTRKIVGELKLIRKEEE